MNCREHERGLERVHELMNEDILCDVVWQRRLYPRLAAQYVSRALQCYHAQLAVRPEDPDRQEQQAKEHVAMLTLVINMHATYSLWVR